MLVTFESAVVVLVLFNAVALLGRVLLKTDDFGGLESVLVVLAVSVEFVVSSCHVSVSAATGASY